jgi:hypothetical protein
MRGSMEKLEAFSDSKNYIGFDKQLARNQNVMVRPVF